MTLILEFERKLTFYTPGILSCAMRPAEVELRATQSRATRHQPLTLSLKHGSAEAKAQLAGLQRLRRAAPTACSQPALCDARQAAGGDGHDARPIRDLMGGVAIVPPNDTSSTALDCRQLH